MCDRSRGIARGDHFALLRHLDATGHRTGWKRQNGNVGRTASASDRATTAVEERVTDFFRVEQGGQLALGLVERPCGPEKADLLVRVGIADHDLLKIAAGLECSPVDGQAKE